jgi:hypothetical protein
MQIRNYLFPILVSVFAILFFKYFISNVNMQEGFELTDKSIKDFLLIQNTINPQKVFDTEILKQQVDQKELDYFIQHQKWNWSNETIEKYKDALRKNPYIRTDITDAVNYAQSIYNERAILQVLKYQEMTKLYNADME